MSKQPHQQQHSESTSDYEEQERYDPLTNLLRLQLRKPKHWNWELSTSRSCNNIALPRILLYDNTGALLLDADGFSEQTYRPISVPDCRRKLSTANHYQRLQQARLPGEFNGLCINEAALNDTPTPVIPFTRQQIAGSCIDLSTHELPNWQPHEMDSSRRSSSLRGARLEIQDHRLDQPQQLTQKSTYPTPPSTSTLTTTANSSSSGPREKRRYRRSHSSGQRSILERFSMTRGRHSSPEYIQEQVLEHKPRYYLCSSKAGTLVIQDESFNRVRQRRRRQRNSSSENVLVQQNRSPAGSVVQVTSHKRHQQQLRCREALLLTSDEETQAQSQRQSVRHSRCRHAKRISGNDGTTQEIIKVDTGNCMHQAVPCATRR
ncbi:uncharacterized protein LOC135440102 [Drosophila montana]|uniref:uncharacterized protein LOC135440102 n=1 Tax=Drosophila montana TaxID=40370 RepID=UPI00313B5021